RKSASRRESSAAPSSCGGAACSGGRGAPHAAASTSARSILMTITSSPVRSVSAAATVRALRRAVKRPTVRRMATHRERILDQFTRQAMPFSTAPGIKDERALELLVEASGAGPTDSVLDVACGPGLVVAAFARVAAHATGIDVTPAMLARARQVTTGLT